MNHQTTELLRALAVVLSDGHDAAMAAGEENLARVLDTMTETATALVCDSPSTTTTAFEDVRNRYRY